MGRKVTRLVDKTCSFCDEDLNWQENGLAFCEKCKAGHDSIIDAPQKETAILMTFDVNKLNSLKLIEKEKIAAEAKTEIQS